MTGPRILVRGVNDVGSAVAHALVQAGYAVVLHDAPAPATSRRGMAFADAVFDGEAALVGIVARRLDELTALDDALASGAAIPLYVGDIGRLLEALRPDALVDARMRKRATPERQIGLAPLTIGLGPNFVAGEATDLVVETGYGPDLGRVIEQGGAHPLGGEPRPIDGVARERYVYAPVAGIFRTRHAIGDLVAEGEPVAAIEPIGNLSEAPGQDGQAYDRPAAGRGEGGQTGADRQQAVALTAPIPGALRGLTRDGVPVAVRAKVIEVDPRGAAGQVRGIGERPGAIAAGVLAAIHARLPSPDVAARRVDDGSVARYSARGDAGGR